MLKLSNIKKSFNGYKAVDNLTIDINRGTILGLIGPNGAGKSTTISMIAGLLKPDGGSILYKDQDIVKRPQILQVDLGFVPQEIALYETLSGKDNLKFFAKAYGLRGDQLNRRIDEVVDMLGMRDKLDYKVNTYSGGMQRRLNIAAALLHEPKILIFDEPTVGIDPQSRHLILTSIKSLGESGITIIYTSHYMEEVEFLCTDICIMDNGKIIEHGSKDQLLAAHAVQCAVPVVPKPSLENVFLELTGKALRD